MIEVVTGLLIRDGRVFLQQRPAGKRLEFLWETPGGKVEPTESHHDALRRELKEELGITVKALPEGAFWCDTVHFPEHGYPSLFLVMYRVTDFDGEPVPKEGQGTGWFEPDSLSGLPLTPGNHMALRDVIRATRRPS